MSPCRDPAGDRPHGSFPAPAPVQVSKPTDPPAPPTVTISIRGPDERSDLPGLCARVCALLVDAHGGVVDCQVTGIAADAVTIDAMARLQLAARRHGCRIRLRDASAEVTGLVAFLGLRDVLTS